MAWLSPYQTFLTLSLTGILSQTLYQGSKSYACVPLLVSPCVCRPQQLFPLSFADPGGCPKVLEELQNPRSSIITPWDRAGWREELLIDGHTSVSTQDLPKLLWPARERNCITECQLCFKVSFPAWSWPG